MTVSTPPGLSAFATGAPVAFWTAVLATAICAAFLTGGGARRSAAVATVFCAALVIAAPVAGAVAVLAAAGGLFVAARLARPAERRRRAGGPTPPALAPPALVLGRVARVQRVGEADAHVALDGQRWRARFEGASTGIGSRVRVMRIEADGRLLVHALG